jgi:hypothetical protein
MPDFELELAGAERHAATARIRDGTRASGLGKCEALNNSFIKKSKTLCKLSPF